MHPNQKGKVLVTGANGLLGANIVRQLNGLGYTARVMIRKGSNTLSLRGTDYEVYYGKITNENDVFDAVSGCEYVIHSAARTKQSPSHLEAFQEANIQATKYLIKAGKHFNIKRFVFVSTANCFTNGTMENPGTEESGFIPWLEKSGYAFSKYLAQKEVLQESCEHNFPAVVVNPTFLVGSYDAKPSSGQMFLYGYKNSIIFYPPGGKSFVDAEFAANAVCQALTKGSIGEAYLLSGVNMSYKNYFRHIGKIAGKRKILIPIPKALLTMTGKVADRLEQLFSIYLPINLVNAKLLSIDNYFSNKKAKKTLGLKDTDISSALLKSKTWFVQSGYLKQ
jgi:dihydroflavonol-4-reductase